MARLQTVRFLRATKANLDSQASSNNLIIGEPYFITDENRIAVATAVNSYETYAKVSEVSGGGSLTIQDNEVSLTQRSKLNFVGNNLIADNATNTSTDIQMFPNMPADSYINQNVYPALEWIWRHTDGYWYFVTMVLSQTSGYVGNYYKKFKVYKTLDWINHIEVCSYENISYILTNPKIALDSNGNIVVIVTDTTLAVIRTIFFDANDSYNTIYAAIYQNATYYPETTISLNVSTDDRFGVAFFQKHSGSTSYSQLMYVERSAGSGGTWGTPEILGDTPIRAASTSNSAATQLFYTSTNEPIIAFLNNASTTSSKAAFIKKVSGTWSDIFEVSSQLFQTVIDSSNNLYFLPGGGGGVYKYNYSNNSITIFAGGSGIVGIAIDGNNDIYYTNSTTSSPTLSNKFYYKNNINTFHRAIQSYLQIGSVFGSTTICAVGTISAVPYSRQRLTEAYHLIIRTDGTIFMEVI